MGVLHPILSDQAYQNIAYNYFNPPEQLSEYDTEDYAGEHEDLINLYFKTQYGKNRDSYCIKSILNCIYFKSIGKLRQGRFRNENPRNF